MNRPAPSAAAGSAAWLSAAVALAAVLPLLGLPVYFRTDDVHWLGWAIDHPNPLAAFLPRENLFGYYRPVPTIAWWLLYRLFGFAPLGYQLALGAVGVLSMIPLFRIGRRLAGGEWGGLAAVALFHAGFVTILYFYFWFSALTFALEMLLLLLALDTFLDGPARPARPWRFAGLALLAGLAKQPALLVIPAVTLVELARAGGPARRRLAWGAGIALAALALMLVTPFVAHRPEALGRLAPGELIDFALDRYRFYAAVLLGGPAGALAAGAAVVALGTRPDGRPVRGGWLAAAAVMALTLLAGRGASGLLFPAWLLLLAAAAWRTPVSRGWFLAFVVPLAALLGVDFHVSTYLLEPGLMLTVAMVLWVTPLLRRIGPSLERRLTGRPRTALLAGPPLAALLLAAVAHDRIGPLVTMRDVRWLFRSAVESMLVEAPAGATIGYLSYEELGESYAQIRQKPLSRRVEQHKTMSGAQLAKFLRLRGRPDLQVVSVQEADTTGGPAWYLAVNALERGEFTLREGLVEVRAWERRGESAALFRRRDH